MGGAGCRPEPWPDMRDWYEIAFATLEAIAHYEGPSSGIVTLAQGALDRFRSPDGATPFADLRVQIERLKERESELVRALENLCDLILICGGNQHKIEGSVAYRRAKRLAGK